MRRAVLFAAMLVSASAAAHHTTTTTRVGSGFRRSNVSASDVEPPRLDVAATYALSYFDRALQGNEPYERARLGSVATNLFSVSAGLELETRTSAELRVPFGFVLLSPPEAETQTYAGLGDLQLTCGQELLQTLLAEPTLPVSVRAVAGLTFPTGRYEPSATLSALEVTAGDAGTVDLAQYDARASLGAGVWALNGGLRVGWNITKRWSVQAVVGVSVPVTETSDSIRWGTDLELGLAPSFQLLRNVLSVRAGGDYRFHAHDDALVEDETTGVLQRRAVGGRDEIGVVLGIDARVSKALTCSLWGRAAVWQNVGDVQLVETASTLLGCGYALGL